MRVTLDLRERVARALGANGADVERAILETIVAAAVREATISSAQARRILNLSRYEMHGLLKRHRAGFEMAVEELEQDTASALAFSH